MANRPIASSVRLVIAGETAPNLAEAVASRAAVEQAAAAHGVAESIRWTDGERPVRAVLAEAHAMGLPVVASALGSAGEILTASGAGVTFAAGDAGALARAAKGLAQNPGLRAALSAAARKHYGAELTPAAAYGRLSATYARAMARIDGGRRPG